MHLIPLIILGVVLFAFGMLLPKAYKVFATLVIGSTLGGCTWSLAAMLVHPLISLPAFCAFMVGGWVAAGIYVAKD